MGTYRYRPTMNFGGFSFPPGVKTLLLINAALFILPEMLGLNLWRPLGLGLVPFHVTHGLIWQVFTYQFFHGGFSHFLFNMLVLWMFGAAIEGAWGMRRFITYYLACGTAAGICVVAIAVLFGGPAEMMTPTIGSSGAIFGLILAFGMLFPDAPVLVMFIFPMPAKYFAILMGFIEFFLQRTQPGSPVSHVAHLGGMAFGIFYIKFWMKRSRPRTSTAQNWQPPGARHRTRWVPELNLRGRYERWRIRRARRKFEVWMRERERENERQDNRWVN